MHSPPRKGIIAWFAHNPVAANLLMLVIITVGLGSAFNIQRAMFPAIDIEFIMIELTYPGAAPEEVLEEINKGELPDEVRGQQRAIQEERQRQANKAETRNKQQVEADAHRAMEDEDEEFSALNTNKRDRRTIEDFEREKTKKPRG